MKLDRLQLMIVWDDRPTAPRQVQPFATFQLSDPSKVGSVPVKLSDDLLARVRDEVTKQLLELGKIPKDLEPQPDRVKPAVAEAAAVEVPKKAAKK